MSVQLLASTKAALCADGLHAITTVSAALFRGVDRKSLGSPFQAVIPVSIEVRQHMMAQIASEGAELKFSERIRN